MKKYKLIKEYPGSPKLGAEAIKEVGVNNSYPYSIYDKRNSIPPVEGYIGAYNKETIEDFPEYWEEIKSKEWEILSFKTIKTDILIQLPFPGFTKKDYFGKEACWKIHSVRRLSDGEVFTIGDKCHLSNGNGYMCPIDKFTLKNNGLEVWLNTNHGSNNWGPFSLSIICKHRQPLFTTEDGVDIYEGDMVYSVGNPTTNENYKYKESQFIATKDLHQDFKNIFHKYFSTKEKAQEYIDYNKPIYSLKDIENHFRLLKRPSLGKRLIKYLKLKPLG